MIIAIDFEVFAVDTVLWKIMVHNAATRNHSVLIVKTGDEAYEGEHDDIREVIGEYDVDLVFVGEHEQKSEAVNADVWITHDTVSIPTRGELVHRWETTKKT